MRLGVRGVAFVAAVCFAGPLDAEAAGGEILLHEDFEAGIGERWGEQSLPSIARKNVFSTVVDEEGNHYLAVASAKSASGLGVSLSFSASRCPHLSWRWKVSSVIEAADLSQKRGDDAAAKLYVVFEGPSRWNPFDQRILVYVWDNRVPVGSVVPNAWLPERERMWVLESGADRAGQWVSERVHLARDFGRAFPGEALQNVQALVFTADTDNTLSHVTAGLDDLVIRCGSGDAEEPRG